MVDPQTPKPSISQRLLTVFPPIILILANIFLFGPFTIYQGNTGDFGIALTPILQSFLLPSLVLAAILAIVGLVPHGGFHRRYAALLLAIGLLLWLQGNLLVWDYGVIGKGEIDWSQAGWRGWVDSSIWLVFIAGAIIFYKHLYKVVRPTSVSFILLQSALLIFGSIQTPGIWKNEDKQSSPQQAIFDFSARKNVIHIILDELQTDVFRAIIETDTAYYRNVFEGFTLFEETMGPFPTTLMSVPAFLSGRVYKNDIPIPIFLDSAYRQRTLSNVLIEKGYEVDIAAEQGWYGAGRHTNYYRTPVPYGVAQDQYEATNSSFMLNLTLSRHAPHFLKKNFFEGKLSIPMLNLKQTGTTENYEALLHFSQKAFLQDLIDNMSAGREKPVYKYIHLNTTHWPMVLDSNCGNAGRILPFTWENIMNQAKCSLDHFIGFLERLKALGIYDSSLIVINADHGYWKISESVKQLTLRNADRDMTGDFHDEEDFAQKVCAASPMLAIKLPNQKGPLRTSEALTSITDIPATLNSLLDLREPFEGRSVYDLDGDTTRERRFFYYYDLPRSGDEYLNRIDEYVIRGKARDRSSWRFASSHIPPGASQATSKIVFGSKESANYLGFGWSYREMAADKDGLTFTWATGSASSLNLVLPKTAVRLTANVKALMRAGDQSVKVRVDGKEVGGWVNREWSQWEKHSVNVEADGNRPDVSTVEFIFSKYIEPAGKEYRKLALLFESLTIEEIKQ